MTVLNDQRRFEVTAASITRRRYAAQLDTENNDEGGTWNILPLTVEVNIFESIFEPVMTGSIAIADTASLSSIINFSGTEILNLQWRVGERRYNKNFYIWSVSTQIKSPNTTGSTLILEFVERHGYISEFTYMNSASAGNVADIIRDIFQSKLGTDLSRWVEASQNMRIMHNNRQPLDIVRWLARRATNSIGEPIFCHATMPKGGTSENAEVTDVRFTDLNTMLNTYEWEDNEVFRYTLLPSQTPQDAFTVDNYRIQGIDIPENDNIIMVAQRGAMRSTYYNIDLFNNNIESTPFDAQRHFTERQRAGSVSQDGATAPFDTFFSPDETNSDIPVANRDSTFVSGINTTRAFDDGYHLYNEERAVENHRFKLSRESVLTMIEKQRFSIIVPGYLFGSTDQQRGAGTMVNIMIPKDQPSHTPNTNTIDAKRSGRFLIINQRHIMNAVTNDYKVVLELGRPDTIDNVNDPSRYYSEREQRPR